MTGIKQTEQYTNGNSLQNPEVSSSSDLYKRSPVNTHNFFPKCRKSYRREYRFCGNPNIILNVNMRTLILQDPPTCTGQNQSEIETKWAALGVVCIFMSALLALFLVYTNFPKLEEEEKQHVKIPWDIEQAKQLALVLNRYKDDNYYEVLTGVFVTYIFLQTFAIPGSLFLSILSGFLFPFFQALALVCSCSAIGASLCFMLSQLLGRRLVLKYFPERAAKWAVIVRKHGDNLLNYIIFLRITPFLPNWFINLTAPVIGVPLVPFALGTFLGVAPPSFVAIQAGQTLNTMSASDSTFSWTSFLLLGVFAVVSLIPIFLRKQLKEKLE